MKIRPRLEALLLQAQALEAQIGALMNEVGEDELDEAAEAPCPRCGGTEFAAADDVKVCAGCNANLRATQNGWEVVDG